MERLSARTSTSRIFALMATTLDLAGDGEDLSSAAADGLRHPAQANHACAHIRTNLFSLSNS